MQYLSAKINTYTCDPHDHVWLHYVCAQTTITCDKRECHEKEIQLHVSLKIIPSKIAVIVSTLVHVSSVHVCEKTVVFLIF
jgi:hypothetical protein